MFSKIGLQLRYYRVLSKALLGFSVPDNQSSMTAHQANLPILALTLNPNPNPNPNTHGQSWSGGTFSKSQHRQ